MLHPLSENEFTSEERSVAYKKVCKKMDEQFQSLIEDHEKFSMQQSMNKKGFKKLKDELESALKSRKDRVRSFFDEYDHKIVLVDDFIGCYEKDREDEYRGMVSELMHDANDSNSPLLIVDPIVERYLTELIDEFYESNKQIGSNKNIDNPICYASGRLIASPLFD